MPEPRAGLEMGSGAATNVPPSFCLLVGAPLGSAHCFDLSVAREQVGSCAAIGVLASAAYIPQADRRRKARAFRCDLMDGPLTCEFEALLSALLLLRGKIPGEFHEVVR